MAHFESGPKNNIEPTHQTIAIRCCRIDAKQQRQFTLIDLVDTQDAREVGYDPWLVVDREIQLIRERPTPQADHLLTRPHPKVARQALGHVASGQGVAVYRLTAFGTTRLA